MISPFSTKLTTMQIMLEDIVFSAQIAFFIGTVAGIIVISLSLLNLMMDFKTKVIQGRKGIYEGFHMEEVEVKDASNFPGFVISTSVGGFVIVVLFVTIMFTFISWPLFWLYLWSI